MLNHEIYLHKNHYIVFENKFQNYLDCNRIDLFDPYVEKIVKFIDFNGEFVECCERLEKDGDFFTKFFI